MTFMNNVSLTGRITRDPEVKYTNSGTACLSFNVAVDKMPDANGNKQANFIPCVAWGSTAKFIGDYVKKGNMLSVTGEIQTRSYQDKNNETKIVVEVLANRVENLSPRPQEKIPQQQPQYQAPPQPQYQNNPNSFNVGGSEDDLPF